MITCTLQGGLGNQMFQISTAYSHSIDCGDDFAIDFESCYTPNQGNPSSVYRNNFFKKIKNEKNIKSEFIYREPKFSYEQIPNLKNITLNGFFQSEKYFDHNREHIQDLFDIGTNNEVLNFLDSFKKGTTSVHVRRGDYLKFSNYHAVLSIDYYINSMSLFNDCDFIIISDDMNWVKKNFIGDNIIYSPFSDEVNDLQLMINCDNNIIANSSFSWWGAYLNKNIDKKIISPSLWFGPNGPKDTQDILPKNWKKI